MNLPRFALPPPSPLPPDAGRGEIGAVGAVGGVGVISGRHHFRLLRK